MLPGSNKTGVLQCSAQNDSKRCNFEHVPRYLGAKVSNQMIVRGKYEHKSIVQGHFAAHETGVGVVQGNSLQNKLVLSSTPALKQQFDNIKTAIHTPALQTNSCLTTSNIKTAVHTPALQFAHAAFRLLLW